MKKPLHILFSAVGITTFFALAVPYAGGHTEGDMAEHTRLTESDTVSDMVNHPAFTGFGEHLLPRYMNSHKEYSPL